MTATLYRIKPPIYPKHVLRYFLDGWYSVPYPLIKPVPLIPRFIWEYEVPYPARSIACMSKKGPYIVFVTYWGAPQGYVRLFSIENNVPLWEHFIGVRVGPLSFSTASISDDGSYFAVTGFDDNKIRLYSKESPVPLWEYVLPDWCRAVSISGDGEWIVAGTDYYGTGFYWHRIKPEPLWKYTTGVGKVISTAISKDGRFVAGGGDGGFIAFFDREKIPPVRPIWHYHGTGWMWSLAMTPDGSHVVAGSLNAITPGMWGTVYFFPKEPSKKLCDRVDCPEYGRPLGDLIWSHELDVFPLYLSITPDGKYIAVGTHRSPFADPPQGITKFLKYDKEGKLLWLLEVPGNWMVLPVAISADGRIIAGVIGDHEKYTGEFVLFENEKKVFSYPIDLALTLSGDLFLKYISAGTTRLEIPIRTKLMLFGT